MRHGTVVALWKAGAPDLSQFGSMTSWTSSREGAEEYRSTIYFGGPVMYQTAVEIDATVLDLRADLAAGLEGFGLDRNDYYETPHDLIRELAPVFTAFGYRWVAIAEEGYVGDEWLYLGEEPIAAIPAIAQTKALQPKASQRRIAGVLGVGETTVARALRKSRRPAPMGAPAESERRTT